jgi:hypothetical protein
VRADVAVNSAADQSPGIFAAPDRHQKKAVADGRVELDSPSGGTVSARGAASAVTAVAAPAAVCSPAVTGGVASVVASATVAAVATVTAVATVATDRRDDDIADVGPVAG